jgi:hypothetical protein
MISTVSVPETTSTLYPGLAGALGGAGGGAPPSAP